jgi:hypothetical protein
MVNYAGALGKDFAARYDPTCALNMSINALSTVPLYDPPPPPPPYTNTVLLNDLAGWGLAWTLENHFKQVKLKLKTVINEYINEYDICCGKNSLWCNKLTF